MKYYVYAYLRTDGTPYYIGKGLGNRAWVKKGRKTPPPPADRIKIVAQHLTEPEAYLLEVKLIDKFGRKDLGTGTLRNETPGGDAPPSRKNQPNKRHRVEDNFIPALDSNGAKIHVRITDTRWATGEIRGINAGRVWTAEERKKNGAGLSKLKWWNNGTDSLRTAECPGPEWKPGRGFIKGSYSWQMNELKKKFGKA